MAGRPLCYTVVVVAVESELLLGNNTTRHFNNNIVVIYVPRVYIRRRRRRRAYKIRSGYIPANIKQDSYMIQRENNCAFVIYTRKCHTELIARARKKQNVHGQSSSSHICVCSNKCNVLLLLGIWEAIWSVGEIYLFGAKLSKSRRCLCVYIYIYKIFYYIRIRVIKKKCQYSKLSVYFY